MVRMNVNSSQGDREHVDRAPDASAGDAAGIRELVRGVTVRQQAFERHLALGLGVDRAGLDVMDHLMSQGPATPTDLARALDISTAAMTLVLNRLEAAGHVSRDPHPTDRRRVIVTASEASMRQAYGYVDPLIRDVEGVIDSLTPTERETVERFLVGLLGAYDRVTATLD